MGSDGRADRAAPALRAGTGDRVCSGPGPDTNGVPASPVHGGAVGCDLPGLCRSDLKIRCWGLRVFWTARRWQWSPSTACLRWCGRMRRCGGMARSRQCILEGEPMVSKLDREHNPNHTSYVLYFHVVWATKKREPLIDREMAGFLRDFLTEKCEKLEVHLLEQGILFQGQLLL